MRFYLIASLLISTSLSANAARFLPPDRSTAFDCEFSSPSGGLEYHLVIFDLLNNWTMSSGPDGASNPLGSGGRTKDGDSYFAIRKGTPGLSFHLDTASGFATINAKGTEQEGQCAAFTHFMDDEPLPVPIEISSTKDCDFFQAPLMRDTCEFHISVPNYLKRSCLNAGFRIGWHSMTECLRATIPAPSEGRVAGGSKRSFKIPEVNLVKNFASKRNVEITFKNGFEGSRYKGSVNQRGEFSLKNRDGDRLSGAFGASGDIKIKDRFGNSLKGNIDSKGYGSLRDESGNTYKVKPD